jgi:hypothetical protein
MVGRPPVSKSYTDPWFFTRSTAGSFINSAMFDPFLGSFEIFNGTLGFLGTPEVSQNIIRFLYPIDGDTDRREPAYFGNHLLNPEADQWCPNEFPSGLGLFANNSDNFRILTTCHFVQDGPTASNPCPTLSDEERAQRIAPQWVGCAFRQQQWDSVFDSIRVLTNTKPEHRPLFLGNGHAGQRIWNEAHVDAAEWNKNVDRYLWAFVIPKHLCSSTTAFQGNESLFASNVDTIRRWYQHYNSTFQNQQPVLILDTTTTVAPFEVHSEANCFSLSSDAERMGRS